MILKEISSLLRLLNCNHLICIHLSTVHIYVLHGMQSKRIAGTLETDTVTIWRSYPYAANWVDDWGGKGISVNAVFPTVDWVIRDDGVFRKG